jgi:hypothetical protein
MRRFFIVEDVKRSITFATEVEHKAGVKICTSATVNKDVAFESIVFEDVELSLQPGTLWIVGKYVPPKNSRGIDSQGAMSARSSCPSRYILVYHTIPK